MHQDRDQDATYQRVEVITGARRRRDWSVAEKARIVAESFIPDANVSEVARRNGVSRNLLSVWRREARKAVAPVTRRLPKGDVVDRLQSFGFPPPCYPNYGASDSCPGRPFPC